MKRNLINPDKSYTFSDYFKMRLRTEEVLGYFGYSKQNEQTDLPMFTGELPQLQSLADKINEVLIHISLENEITRREFLLAPIMFEVRHLTHAKLNSEYWIEINNQLKGSLDYYLKRENELLVVEAKNADLTRAFTQLAVELVAVDMAGETDKNTIYGAVSTGQEWQFGRLDREKKRFFQDIKTYTVPSNLEEIMRILVGILEVK
jgi:hypothetical protein